MEDSIYITKMIGGSLQHSSVTKKLQAECRYCHLPYRKWDGGYWDESTWQITSYRDARGRHYELIGIGYEPDSHKLVNLPTEISFCPKCGRDLRKG